MEPPGQMPPVTVVNEVVVGSFEEEEEGAGIVRASDISKVKDEDSATPRLSEGGQGGKPAKTMAKIEFFDG